LPQQIELVALEFRHLLRQHLRTRPRRARRPVLADAARFRRRFGARHALQSGVAIDVAAGEVLFQVLARQRRVVACLGQRRMGVRRQVRRRRRRRVGALLAVGDDRALRQRPPALDATTDQTRGGHRRRDNTHRRRRFGDRRLARLLRQPVVAVGARQVVVHALARLHPGAPRLLHGVDEP
jgi:hypothetical protein